MRCGFQHEALGESRKGGVISTTIISSKILRDRRSRARESEREGGQEVIIEKKGFRAGGFGSVEKEKKPTLPCRGKNVEGRNGKPGTLHRGKFPPKSDWGPQVRGVTGRRLKSNEGDQDGFKDVVDPKRNQTGPDQ